MITPDPDLIRRRYETILNLYNNEYIPGLNKELSDGIFISKELLHCAVNAYFDDIFKYKAYAGSEYADRHKQAAFTMIWISRFKPIQIKNNIVLTSAYLTINESFAIYSGLAFLKPTVIAGMTESFYNHLIYTLTYREVCGRSLATILYLMEKASDAGAKF